MIYIFSDVPNYILFLESMGDGGKIMPTADILALMQSSKSGAQNTSNHSVPNQTRADKKAQEETVSKNLPTVPDECGEFNS